TRQTADSLKRFFRTYDQRRKWLGIKEIERWNLATPWERKNLASHLAAYLSWKETMAGMQVCHTADEALRFLNHALAQPSVRQELQAFIESRVAITKALFSFREAWQGPQAAIYDEQRLFSSQPINQYDLLHLLANYDLYIYDSKAQFEQNHGPVPLAAKDLDVYAFIRGFRRPKWVIGFAYHTPWSREEFEAHYCQTVTALRGLQLRVREQGASGVWQTLDTRVAAALEEDWAPCLVITKKSEGALLRVLRVAPFVARELMVVFPDGIERSYHVVTGTAAFHVQAEMRGHFAHLEKQQPTDVIFC
ncbi:MAG: hypothetical protein MI924_37430, partial [Chloroflexales bacterium]|nr:hypothetical protein [Chloroflexales bacterium]